MSGYARAAREAPREYGLLSGAYLGAWDNYCSLQNLALELHGQRIPEPQPAPDPPLDTADNMFYRI